ncbi:uncharacterized protein LOC117333658 [Pecten maximus]|uniref:uncharacterized protein LOC117333658 n=1 Tax=Pecten maximus TaxID=6579 RepID=UPI001457EEA4|nr:uncharacterized protein LOC117333658 [Pecten maximus]
MPIQYSCVVCGTKVLCSYQTAAGPFEKLLTSRLSEISTYKKGKKFLNAGSYVYYTITENDVTFLCTVTADVTVMQSYAFLIQVKTLFWQAGFGSRDLMSAEPHELDAEFVAVLDTQMELYSSDNIPQDNEISPPDEESMVASETSELADLVDEFELIDVSDIKEDEDKVKLKVNTFQDRVRDMIIKEAGVRAEKTEELEFFVEKNSKRPMPFERTQHVSAGYLGRRTGAGASYLALPSP